MSAAAFAVATGNRGKLGEFRRLLGDLGVELLALADLPPIAFPDEGDDYTENSAAKARAAAAASGLVALADDSGLEVDALSGAPGPRSARYGGPGLDDAGRVAHLLEALRGIPRERRTARFVCVAAVADPDGRVITARGECPGRILEAPRGAGGFGYDPVFWVDSLAASVAELPAAAKDAISHRGRAIAALAPVLHQRAKISSGVGTLGS